MVAFTIFGRPIYRYGLFYLATFAFGYAVLRWLGTTNWFSSYKGLQRLLTDKRDDLMLVGLIGVIVGGRAGHVLLYDAAYYIQHLDQIRLIQQGGMSFIGGVIGVVLGIFYLAWKMKLSKNELFLLGDIILCIVPLGVLLGRIGNYLNQELWGLPIADLPPKLAQMIENFSLVHVYDRVDEQPRVNTNFIQSFGEGILPFFLGRGILLSQYAKKHVRPGLITGLFFMTYATVRFFVEFLKDLPTQEILGPLSVSQRIMIIFFAVGAWFAEQAQEVKDNKA